MTLNLPLMENNISREDLNAVIDFLSQDPAPILTNSKKSVIGLDGYGIKICGYEDLDI